MNQVQEIQEVVDDDVRDNRDDNGHPERDEKGVLVGDDVRPNCDPPRL